MSSKLEQRENEHNDVETNEEDDDNEEEVEKEEGEEDEEDEETVKSQIGTLKVAISNLNVFLRYLLGPTIDEAVIDAFNLFHSAISKQNGEGKTDRGGEEDEENDGAEEDEDEVEMNETENDNENKHIPRDIPF